MSKRLSDLNIDYQILDAVDFKDLEPTIKRHFSLRMLRVLSLGEIACAMSHRLALQRIVDGGHPYGIVLEDDAILPDDFSDWIDSLSAYPDDMELVKLSGHYAPYQHAWKFGEHKQRDILFAPRCSSGTACYLVKAGAAKKLAANLSIIDEPIDRLLANQYRNRINLYEVCPFPVRLDECESTISDRLNKPLKKDFKLVIQKKIWRFQQSMGMRYMILRKLGLFAAINAKTKA